MHIAAANGHGACVEALLQNGCIMAASDPNDKTPIALALEAGHMPVADILQAASLSS